MAALLSEVLQEIAEEIFFYFDAKLTQVLHLISQNTTYLLGLTYTENKKMLLSYVIAAPLRM